MATVQAVTGNLTAAERGILTAINSGASSLSLVGSGFIVLCYLLFKELRKFSFKLVFFLALSVSVPAHFVICDLLFTIRPLKLGCVTPSLVSVTVIAFSSTNNINLAYY